LLNNNILQNTNPNRKNLIKKTWFIEALKAIEYIHSEKYVHRDIKPSNILLFNQDNQWVTKISDFGIGMNEDESRR
jgi:serine/threonine protein kinase